MENFNKLIREQQREILDHTVETLNNNFEDGETIDLHDLHYRAFNEDYYIIGYYEAAEWLKKSFSIFEAIEIVQDYEKDHFGETNTKINAEAICNMLIYIIGEEIIYSLDEGTKEEIKQQLENL